MDWIHCNNCFNILVEGITFYLTSCGHMFCSNCLNPNLKEWTCTLCKSSCKIIKLEPNLSSDVQDFFTEPEEILNKLLLVLEFQKKHRKRLTSYYIQLPKKYLAAKAEIKRLNELAHKMNEALKSASREIKHYKSMYKSQTGVYMSPPSMAIATTRSNCSASHPSHLTREMVPISKGHVALPMLPYTNNNQLSQVYQSNLVTPNRLSKQRITGNMSAGSQRSHLSCNSLNVLSPITPGSVGSNYSTASSSVGISPHSRMPPRPVQHLPRIQACLMTPKNRHSNPAKPPGKHMSEQFNRLSMNKSYI